LYSLNAVRTRFCSMVFAEVSTAAAGRHYFNADINLIGKLRSVKKSIARSTNDRNSAWTRLFDFSPNTVFARSFLTCQCSAQYRFFRPQNRASHSPKYWRRILASLTPVTYPLLANARDSYSCIRTYFAAVSFGCAKCMTSALIENTLLRYRFKSRTTVSHAYSKRENQRLRCRTSRRLLATSLKPKNPVRSL
jgi:hypothetical protein